MWDVDRLFDAVVDVGLGEDAKTMLAAGGRVLDRWVCYDPNQGSFGKLEVLKAGRGQLGLAECGE